MNPPADRTHEHNVNAALRRLPSVNRIAELIADGEAAKGVPHAVIAMAARRAIDSARAGLSRDPASDQSISERAIARAAVAVLERECLPPLRPVINATGVLLHTGLGRAPLADSAVDALAMAARSYAPVELDMDTGLRGKRPDLVRPLLCELTGAESATVVNNNAAAMLLVLSALAGGNGAEGNKREVIVSRGELVEIGGSFRLPEVIETGGAILREVGTTNKTRPIDYARAIGENTAALLKVHTSNFRIEGFTDAATVAQLAELGRTHDLPVFHDIGSGALDSETYAGLPGDEPDVRTSIRAGADLVLFSGDKLLGGPQAGIIVGRKKWIDRIERHPLMRALRVGKLTLAALGPTLQLHRDPAALGVPIRDMTRVSPDVLRIRAETIVAALLGHDGVEARAVETSAYLGGGAAPADAIPSWAVAVTIKGTSEGALFARLRGAPQPVIARINDGTVLLDLRAVFEGQDDALVRAVEHAAASS
jgi:L-seryl-tRNA(Ser) seleniumtransferase